MSISLTQKHAIVVFTALFILLGSGAPVLYAGATTSQEDVRISNFKAENSVTQASTHTICFEKGLNQALSDNSQMSMYMLSHENGQMHKIQIKERVHTALKNDTVTAVDFSTQLPRQAGLGKHSYMLVIDSHERGDKLAQTRAFMSDEFNIVENRKTYTSQNITCK